VRAGAIAQAETTSFPPSASATREFHPRANGSGTPNALLGSRSRRRRRGGYFVSRDDASYNLSVCDSKQTVAAVWRPRPSRDTARFTQPGREVPRPSGTGTTLGETLVRLGSPDASSRRCTADSRHPPISRMMLCIEPRPSLRSEDPVGIPLAGPTGSLFF
jgi:hypothetical protein